VVDHLFNKEIAVDKQMATASAIVDGQIKLNELAVYISLHGLQ